VDANGDYSGEVPAGSYTVIFTARLEWKRTSRQTCLQTIKVVAGQDVAADIDNVAPGITSRSCRKTRKSN